MESNVVILELLSFWSTVAMGICITNFVLFETRKKLDTLSTLLFLFFNKGVLNKLSFNKLQLLPLEFGVLVFGKDDEVLLKFLSGVKFTELSFPDRSGDMLSLVKEKSVQLWFCVDISREDNSCETSLTSPVKLCIAVLYCVELDSAPPVIQCTVKSQICP